MARPIGKRHALHQCHIDGILDGPVPEPSGTSYSSVLTVRHRLGKAWLSGMADFAAEYTLFEQNFYSRASCEARPQHYVIILQSQPISCTRRTFLSFFLHHFDEYTEDKLLFKANLPAFFESFHLRLTMFSQYYDSFRIISFFCSNVFYSSLPVIP